MGRPGDRLLFETIFSLFSEVFINYFMLTLRKIDYTAQTVLGIITVLSLPIFFAYGLLAGLFLLGSWQLFSAFFNTSSFLSSGLGRHICNYWKFTGLVFAFLFLCIPVSGLFKPDEVQLLGAVAVAGSIPLSVYYMVIYKKLIGHFVLRHELSGLLRSKH